MVLQKICVFALVVGFCHQLPAQIRPDSPIRSVLVQYDDSEQTRIREMFDELTVDEPTIDELTRPHLTPAPRLMQDDATRQQANPIGSTARYFRNRPERIIVADRFRNDRGSENDGTVKLVPRDTANSETGAASSVTIQTIGPDSTTLNQPAEFRVIVSNKTAATAHDVMLRITLSNGTRLQKATPSGTSRPGNVHEFFAGAMPAGEVKEFQIEVIPTIATPIELKSRIYFASATELSVPVYRSGLSLEVSKSGHAESGSVLVNRLIVRNTGMGSIDNLTITQACDSSSVSIDRKNRTRNIKSLSPGEAREVDFFSETKLAGTAVFRFDAKSTAATASTSRQVNVTSNQVELVCRGARNPHVGAKENYSVAVTNRSETTVKGVSVVCRLPAEFDITILDRHADYDERSQSYRWQIPQIGAGKSEVIQFQAVARRPGSQMLEYMMIQGSMTLGNQKHEFAAVQTTIAQQPQLKNASQPINGTHPVAEIPIVQPAAVKMLVEGPTEPVVIGETVKMTVRVLNSSDSQAKNVRVGIALPGGIGVYRSEQYTLEGNQVLCHGFDLDAGQQRDFTIQFVGSRQGAFKISAAVESNNAKRTDPQQVSVNFIEAAKTK